MLLAQVLVAVAVLAPIKFMKKQIIIGVFLIIIGIVLGFFVIVNWQLRQEINKTESVAKQAQAELDKIEKYLSPPAEEQKQP